MCSNVATNISKHIYTQIIQSSTVAHTKTTTTHPDTGASGIYLMCQPSLYISKAPTLRGIWPNGVDIISVEITQLEIPYIPKEATTARVFNNITSSNLLSIGKMCDAGCIATFTEIYFKIFNREGQCILTGTSSLQNILWGIQVDLLPTAIPRIHHANTIVRKKTTDIDMLQYHQS